MKKNNPFNKIGRYGIGLLCFLLFTGLRAQTPDTICNPYAATDYITEAKRVATKERRLEKIAPMILALDTKIIELDAVRLDEKIAFLTITQLTIFPKLAPIRP